MARGVAGAGLVLTGVALVVVGGWLVAEPRGEAAAAHVAAAGVVPAAHPLLAPAPQAQRAGVREPAAFARWLDDTSSLRGVELDGSWDVDGQGRLHPTVALRRRFDQLLTLAGEARVEEIGAYIEHEVRELVGADGAAAVLDAWQRYLALQRQPQHTGIDPHNRQTLLAALAERQQLRRRVLGNPLAEAFFADDEAQLQALLQGRRETQAGPQVQSTRIDRSRLDAPAQARLRQEEAAWADWQRRLADARREVARLNAAPELSPLQRQQAIEQLIARRFDPQDAAHARALLQVPSTL